MNGQYDPVEKARLEALFNASVQHADSMGRDAHKASIEIAKEKTQYFEKIALGCGATIALMVSFVGSHQGRLQPPWLLRSALAILVLAMICSMLRNWRFPFYTLAYHMGQKLKAERGRENRKKELITSIPSLDMEGGKPIDVDRYLLGFNSQDTGYAEAINRIEREEKLTFSQVKWIELATLMLAVLGMTSLIALAWLNF